MSARTQEPGGAPGDNSVPGDTGVPENDGPRMEATASRRGRVYQAGRDQRIVSVTMPRSVRNALLGLVVLTLLVGGGWAVVKWVLPLSAPTYKTQLLIDTTASADPKDITDSVGKVVGNSGTHDALALRTFGGRCGAEDNTTRLVGFGTDNRQEIAEAAAGVSAGGSATLLRGIIRAVEDFSEDFAFGADQRAKQVNRIIVVTRHGQDACDQDTAFVQQEIRDRIQAAGLKIQFRLIGYRVPEDQRDTLKQIATAGSANSDPVFAGTPSELNDALEWSTNVEPVLRNATKIVDTLNRAVKHIDIGVQAINNGRLDVAGSNLEQARKANTGTEFEDLEGRTNSPDGRDIHDRATKLRDQQERVLTAADRLRDAAQSEAPLQSRHEAFKKAAQNYNTQVGAMNEALAGLRAKGPGVRL